MHQTKTISQEINGTDKASEKDIIMVKKRLEGESMREEDRRIVYVDKD